ncbi:MAG: hypothetical protein AAF598_19040, partial [Bacteroidota bacterium]
MVAHRWSGAWRSEALKGFALCNLLAAFAVHSLKASALPFGIDRSSSTEVLPKYRPYGTTEIP